MKKDRFAKYYLHNLTPDVDPSEVEGKLIKEGEVATQTYYALARQGLRQGNALNAGVVAELSPDYLKVMVRNIGEKRIKELQNVIRNKAGKSAS